jgi:hypothetical protein
MQRQRNPRPYARAVRLAVALSAAAVLAVSAAPRIALAAGTLPDPLRPFIWSDALLLYVRGLNGHHLPYADVPFEYPPLIALVSAIASLLASSATAFVALWAVAQIAAGAVAAAILTSAAGAARTMRRFALAPQLLLLGAINFDLLPVVFLCAALVAARRGHELRAGLHLALGTLSKLFPLAAAPVLLTRARGPVRITVAGLAVLAAGYVPAALAGRTAAFAPAYYLVGIPANFDSPWGLLAAALESAGIASAQAIVTVVTLAGLAVTYVAVVLPRARASDPAVPMALAVVATLVWWRLYSPQYSLWMLPLFVLLPLGTRAFALLVAGDALVFVSVYPLTLVRWDPGDGIVTALFVTLVAGVAVRLLALVATLREILALARVTA